MYFLRHIFAQQHFPLEITNGELGHEARKQKRDPSQVMVHNYTLEGEITLAHETK